MASVQDELVIINFLLHNFARLFSKTSIFLDLIYCPDSKTFEIRASASFLCSK